MKVLDESVLSNLLTYIQTYQTQYGRSPSYRTIMHAMKFNNLATVSRYVGKLHSTGKIKKDNLGGIDISFNLKTNKATIAPLLGTVACGEPILAIENIEGNYALPADIFGNGETFLLRAKGESMVGAGIKDKDILVIKKCEDANNGEIVVALINEEATVKRFYKKGKKIILHPENPKFQDIVLDEVRVLGVVDSYIHKF